MPLADFFAANGYSIKKHVEEKLMTTTDSEFKCTQKDISKKKKNKKNKILIKHPDHNIVSILWIILSL